MNQADTRIVTDANGQRGVIESLPDSQQNPSGVVTVRLENGQKLLIPQSVLTAQEDGSFHLPFALAEFLTATARTASGSASPATTTSAAISSALQTGTNRFAADERTSLPATEIRGMEHLGRAEAEEVIIPLAAEQVAVGKRVVETGRVRITKTVSERAETVNVPLISDTVEVERVAVNRVLDTAPEVRREGETLIVPILEEVLVVEKRLMLREELHIRMKREETQEAQQVVLRREDVQVERFPNDTLRTTETVPTTS